MQVRLHDESTQCAAAIGADEGECAVPEAPSEPSFGPGTRPWMQPPRMWLEILGT